MTEPRDDAASLLDLDLDLERTEQPDRRGRSGPVTFSDAEMLQRLLERRSKDRRRGERRGVSAPAAAAELGSRELCHDLRQPLASAVVLTHMLERETGLSAAGRHRLGLLHGELGRLAGMLTAHLEPSATELVDVVAVVRDVCDAPVGSDAPLLALSAAPTPLVLGDPVQMTRLVANLVSNARSAAGPTGAVRVRVGDEGGSVRIVVEDSGSALGDDLAPGFGLGLMIVESVLRRLGGTSTCAASELGGLRVTLTIPAGLPGQDVGECR